MNVLYVGISFTEVKLAINLDSCFVKSCEDLPTYGTLICLLHNSFLMLLSSISSPFFNGILSLLTILAIIWGLVLTIMTFVGLYKRLKPKVKPRWSHFRTRFTKARKPTVSGEVIEEQNMNTEV